jgi:hypothetical protein
MGYSLTMSDESYDEPIGPEADELSSRELIRAQLAESQALIAECARIAHDPVQSASAQIYATTAAARLMAAASQAASAIARIYDCETRRYVAEAQVKGYLPLPHRGRPAARRTPDRAPDRGEAELDRYYRELVRKSEEAKVEINSGPGGGE